MLTTDHEEQQLIVYAVDGQIYRPLCIPIKKVTVIPNTGQCFDNIKVRFDRSGVKIIGFLTEDRILTVAATQKTCSDNIKYVNVGDKTIVGIGQKQSVVNTSAINFAKISFADSKLDINTTHFKPLLNGVDVFTPMQEMRDMVIDSDGTQFKAFKNDVKENSKALEKVGEEISSLWATFTKGIGTVVIIVVMIIISLASFTLIMACCIKKLNEKQNITFSGIGIESNTDQTNFKKSILNFFRKLCLNKNNAKNSKVLFKKSNEDNDAVELTEIEYIYPTTCGVDSKVDTAELNEIEQKSPGGKLRLKKDTK